MILQAVDADQPPLQVPLGPVAYSIAERKTDALRSDMHGWSATAIATDSDE